METKYTAGPWEVYSDGEYRRSIITANRTIVDSVTGYGTSEKEANAKLIAAAPELLESCISLLKEMGVEYDSDPEGYSRIVKTALLAIKKATE